MEVYNHVNRIAKDLGLIYTLCNDISIANSLAKELGANRYNDGIIFPSETPCEFNINGTKYFGLTVPDKYLRPGYFSENNEFDAFNYIHVIYSNEPKDYNELKKYLGEKYPVEKKEDVKCKVLTWDPIYDRYQDYEYKVEFKSSDDLVGLDYFFKTMERDIKAIQNHKDLAKKLGADSGFNYLLYGKPGTGKTTSVKVLAHKLDIPIYCANLKNIRSSAMERVLSPQDSRPIKIILVEDFDRYIRGDGNNSNYMSDLLNALDGVHSTYGTIRIFSANFPENTLVDTALRSRISRFIEFKLPSVEDVAKHIINVFPENKDDAIHFANLISERHMSIRDVNNYLSRFIIDDNPIAEAIKTFPEWLVELDKVKEMEQKKNKNKKVNSNSSKRKNKNKKQSVSSDDGSFWDAVAAAPDPEDM